MNFQTQTSNEHEESSAMNAMVDIVFILLAFFILATQLNQPELDVTLKNSNLNLATGAVQEDFPDIITIQLQNTPKGIAITIGQASLPINGFEHITQKLNQINLPDATVIIGAQNELTVQQVTHAVDAALASSMKKISLTQLVTQPTTTASW